MKTKISKLFIVAVSLALVISVVSAQELGGGQRKPRIHICVI